MNNYPRKIESAENPNVKIRANAPRKNYYVIFFSILIVSFIIIFWLCNYTKLKEMFQIIALSALSIALAEYFTRKFLKL